MVRYTDKASLTAGLIFTCLMASAAPASAATVMIDPIHAGWENASGGVSVVIDNSNSDQPTIRWGNPTGFGKSGYNFDAEATPFNINLVVGGASMVFGLGEFEHINQPITGGSIDSVDLRVTYGVSIDGNPMGMFDSIFSFAHDETTNNANPCAYGPAGQTGVNANGCADRVIATLNPGASQAFTVGGVDYFLDVTGFTVGGLPTSDFLTTERQTNAAQLNASIVARELVTSVPEPATWVMLLLGFFGIGGMMRSAKRKQTVTVSYS